jgi:hypothetical protein
MKEEIPNWSDKSAKVMKDGKEEFAKLQFELFNLMVKFSLKALKTFNTSAENGELNPLQINNIVAHELQSVIGDLNRPDFKEL